MNEWVKPLIWVEGIIGCGKTTFAREVGKRMEMRILEEPVGSNPYLGLFYKDQKKWALPMQFFLLMQRHALQQLASYEATSVGGFNGAILDRSLCGDRVFAKMHMKCGNIEELDWKTYEMSYSIMCRNLLPPTLLVFLDIQPKTAYERMVKRARTEEIGVKLDYLVSLREGYQELLHEAVTGLLPWSHAVRLCRIPWDPDTIGAEAWDAVAQTVSEACRL